MQHLRSESIGGFPTALILCTITATKSKLVLRLAEIDRLFDKLYESVHLEAQMEHATKLLSDAHELMPQLMANQDDPKKMILRKKRIAIELEEFEADGNTEQAKHSQAASG